METSLEQKKTASKGSWKTAGIGMLVILAAAGGLIYWILNHNTIFTDSASVQAPITVLSPTQAGVLQAVFVNEGDIVSANTTVAQVGNELIKAKTGGVIVSVPNKIGALVNAGGEVVDMIDPSQLRLVGKIDEDKGLDRIAVGDPVSFTIDAFGSKKFVGVVDEVAPASDDSGVVFNISDKREIKTFSIKVRFDTSAYPELHNGMSARMWIAVGR